MYFHTWWKLILLFIIRVMGYNWGVSWCFFLAFSFCRRRHVYMLWKYASECQLEGGIHLLLKVSIAAVLISSARFLSSSSFFFFASFSLLRTVRTSLLYVAMSSNNCVSSSYSSSVPELCDKLNVCQVHVTAVKSAYKTSCCAAHRFNDLASSVLNLSMSLSRRSLQPLPFNATGLSSVEKATLRTPAIPSQSVGLLGRTEATSLARATSCFISGQRNCGMIDSTVAKTLLRRLLFSTEMTQLVKRTKQTLRYTNQLTKRGSLEHSRQETHR